jgi:hypothetical protein
VENNAGQRQIEIYYIFIPTFNVHPPLSCVRGRDNVTPRVKKIFRISSISSVRHNGVEGFEYIPYAWVRYDISMLSLSISFK